MRDLERCKSLFDEIYRSKAFQNFHFYYVKFADVLPVVSCGAISPEFDFLGNDIQDILRSEQPIEQVAFNLTSINGHSLAIYGWIDNKGPARDLALTFKQVPSTDKANAAVKFSFEYLANTMMRPSWWNHLTDDHRNRLLRHISAGLPSAEFEHEKLILDNTQFVSSEVIDEIWSD